ncbi:MAG: hypothetical protein WA990_00780 [Rubrobacteraceae bacterium]
MSKEGYFHPVFLFGVFVFSMTVVGEIGMAANMNGTLMFFRAYELAVSPGEMFILAEEQLLLFTAVYAGYVMVRGVREQEFEHTRWERTTLDYLWPVFYFVGIAALLYLILSAGGFGELFGSLGEKYERAAGKGEIVLLVQFAYAGILFWYRKNIARPVWQRYGGIVALNLPLLLSGSRTGMLISLLAAGYMDERTGRRIDLRFVAGAGLLLAIFFAAYGTFRGQIPFDFFSQISKNLSMGIGYVVAVQTGIIGEQFKPEMLLLTFSSILPGALESFAGFPESPNYIFSQELLPGTPVTVSMGVMGEANFVLHYGWSFFYYLLLGITLTWIGSFGWKKSLLLAAVVAGGTVRVAKGGITAGGANIIMIALPIILAYLLVLLWSKYSKDEKLLRRQ